MDPISVEKALGWWICHQDPARTLTLGDVSLPLCARCTAIYLFLGLALWTGLLAGRPGGRSLPLASLAAAAGTGLLLAQWAGAQAGLWTSNATNRILTGLACGAGMGWLLHTAFSLRFRDARGHPWHAAALFCVLAAASCLVLLATPPWASAAHILGAISLAGFYSALAWVQAILLSFVLVRPGGKPRGGIIAAIVLVATVAEALSMSLIRI